MKSCKECKNRKIVKKDSCYYNNCKLEKREDTVFKTKKEFVSDFSDYFCEEFDQLECEKIPYERYELFRQQKQRTKK
jgi:hypothetical protein